MSGATRITDPADDRLSLFLDVRERDFRRETGLFLAEGEHVVRRAFEAVGAGWLPGVRSVLVVEGKADRVLAMAPASVIDAIDILVCTKEVMEKSVGMRLHQGIIAAVEPAPEVSLSEALKGMSSGGGGDPAEADLPHLRALSETIVVCPEVTNTENLGLLVRVCAGLGVGAMVLGPRCCDPWYRRSVRVSMGAVFAMPMVRSVDIEADLGRLQNELGYELVATVIDEDAQDLRDCDPGLHAVDQGNFRRRGRAILLGSEGYGLSAEVVARCDRKVRIPMHAGIDSLNIAVAAGIVVHHFVGSRR